LWLAIVTSGGWRPAGGGAVGQGGQGDEGAVHAELLGCGSCGCGGVAESLGQCGERVAVAFEGGAFVVGENWVLVVGAALVLSVGERWQ
jgi:hypothetical protein